MGFTSAQDILYHFNWGYLFKNSDSGDYSNITRNYFPINIDGYLMIYSLGDAENWKKALLSQKDNFKMKGIKVSLDGSIQGYTGFMNEPYYVLPP